jgi:transcriptional regulator with XRE-family HTH domain
MPLPTEGFGRRLAAIREARGFSQSDLADRLGFHKTYVSKLERGERRAELLPIGDCFKLAYLLGVSPWALLTGWEPARTVDLGVEGAKAVRADRVWAWAAWQDLPYESIEEDDVIPIVSVYHRFSPVGLPGMSDEQWDQVDDSLDRITEALGRPVEYVDDDGDVQLAYHADESVRLIVNEFREALARITTTHTEAKETKKK